MTLRDEFLEFIRDRWFKVTTGILVPILVLISIYAIMSDRSDILWLSIYTFVVIFIILNALYILLAQEKRPAIEAAGKRPAAQRVAKFSLLMSVARIGLIIALLLIPLFRFIPPF